MITINTATATREDIKKAETNELVELYNLIAQKNIKKFENRKIAEERTWNLIQRLAPDEDIRETLIEQPPKKVPLSKKAPKRIMRFCFAPAKEDSITAPKEGTLRAQLFKMLLRKNGVLFSEIQDTFKWSSRNTYEAIRIIHFTTGHGMWSNYEKDGLRVRIVKDQQEYKQLVIEAKKELE